MTSMTMTMRKDQMPRSGVDELHRPEGVTAAIVLRRLNGGEGQMALEHSAMRVACITPNSHARPTVLAKARRSTAPTFDPRKIFRDCKQIATSSDITFWYFSALAAIDSLGATFACTASLIIGSSQRLDL